MPRRKSGTKLCYSKSISLPRVGDYTSPCDNNSVYRNPGSGRLGRAIRGKFMSEVQMKDQESCKVSHVLAMGGGKAVASAYAT